MLKLFIAFFVFCLVLFIYLHINFHMKTSNDLEVFEIEKSNAKGTQKEYFFFSRPAAFLPHASYAVVLTDARPTASLVLASFAVVLADARPAALRALDSYAVVLADA
jgi:hypothetical protein